VAGTALDANQRLHLVRWEKGEIVDLGLFPSSQWRWVTAINDRGVIVGYGDGSSAFVWRDGVFSELTALNGSASSVAYDVDSRGCVVGYSTTLDGEAHATLWCEGRLNACTRPLTFSSSTLSNGPGALTTPPWCITVSGAFDKGRLCPVGLRTTRLIARVSLLELLQQLQRGCHGGINQDVVQPTRAPAI
jgi:probable HAF family extracellular repeat protein